MQARTFTFAPGHVVDGRYEVVHRVGEGGMGEMFLVKDKRLNGVRRALKLLKQSDQQYEQWFEQEAKILTRLQHRCLPTIYDYHISEDHCATYLVMDWIDGIDLEQWISQQPKLTLLTIITIGVEVLHALKYLHEQQPAIIHRDLKPSNIMITRAGTVKVIDFGISKFNGRRGVITAQFGTPGYCAPEQMLGHATSEQSDIYSFGAVMISMLGISLEGYYQQKSRQHDMNSKLRALPKQLSNIITTCIALQQQDRPRSITEVLTVFEQLQSMYETKGRLSIKFDSKRNRIGVLSLEAQAGATCCALAIAELLKDMKQPVAVIELQRGGGTLTFSMLGHENKRNEMEQQQGFIGIVDQNIHYYALQPHSDQQEEDEAESILINGAEMIQLHSLTKHVVVDYGASWQEEDIPLIVDSSDLLIIVCTPWIAAVSQQQLRKLRFMLQKAHTHDINMMWVFNRDQRFQGRQDWLALANDDMKATIPEMKMKLILSDLWTSTTFHRQPYLVKEMKKNLTPLTKKLNNLQ